jgi:hypothetical protein
VLGTAVLVVCGAARLRSPQTDRSYTTLFRFSLELAYYSTVYIGVYTFLFGLSSFAGHVLGGATRGLIGYLDDIPGWIALLVLLVSGIPPMSGWDRALRRHAHSIGGIPSEAMTLREAILKARCEIEESEIYYGVLRRGIDLGNMDAIPDHTLHGLLKHASQLRYILDRCVQGRRFEAFFAANSRLTDELRRRFDNLLFKTSRGFTALGELSGLVDRASGIPDTWNSLGSLVQTEMYTGSSAVLDPAIGTSRVLLSGLREDVRAFLNDTALLLARLTLYERFTERGRVALLQNIGIRAERQPRPRYQVLLAAFGVVLVLLCIGTVLFGGVSNLGLREEAGTVLMVATIFVAALLCAIYPKQYFAFANVNAFGRPPYLFFGAAGLAAMVTAFVIGLTFRMLIFQDAETALWVSYRRSPWLLVSFTLAVIMAILIQDTDFVTLAQRRTRRWRDAGVLTLGLTAAGAAVIFTLRHTDPQNPISAWAAGFVGALGAALGYMVPHRFRKVCPKPDPAVSVTQELEAAQISGHISPESDRERATGF